MTRFKLTIGATGLDYDTDYGIDERTGWSAHYDGHYLVQFVPLPHALRALAGAWLLDHRAAVVPVALAVAAVLAGVGALWMWHGTTWAANPVRQVVGYLLSGLMGYLGMETWLLWRYGPPEIEE